jgi:hypothetical protein
MRADDLLQYLNRRRFEPFRLHLTNGAKHDIRHPEMVKVFRSQAHVYFHRGDNPHDMVLRFDGVALLHINRVEMLDGQPRATAG